MLILAFDKFCHILSVIINKLKTKMKNVPVLDNYSKSKDCIQKIVVRLFIL